MFEMSVQEFNFVFTFLCERRAFKHMFCNILVHWEWAFQWSRRLESLEMRFEIRQIYIVFLAGRNIPHIHYYSKHSVSICLKTWQGGIFEKTSVTCSLNCPSNLFHHDFLLKSIHRREKSIFRQKICTENSFFFSCNPTPLTSTEGQNKLFLLRGTVTSFCITPIWYLQKYSAYFTYPGEYPGEYVAHSCTKMYSSFHLTEITYYTVFIYL